MPSPKFDYNDLVRIKLGVTFWIDVPGRRTNGPRVGEPASVYAIDTDRIAGPRPEFPAGNLYGVEFNDGDAVEVHEDDLELVTPSDITN